MVYSSNWGYHPKGVTLNTPFTVPVKRKIIFIDGIFFSHWQR